MLSMIIGLEGNPREKERKLGKVLTLGETTEWVCLVFGPLLTKLPSRLLELKTKMMGGFDVGKAGFESSLASSLHIVAFSILPHGSSIAPSPLPDGGLPSLPQQDGAHPKALGVDGKGLGFGDGSGCMGLPGRRRGGCFLHLDLGGGKGSDLPGFKVGVA